MQLTRTAISSLNFLVFPHPCNSIPLTAQAAFLSPTYHCSTSLISSTLKTHPQANHFSSPAPAISLSEFPEVLAHQSPSSPLLLPYRVLHTPTRVVLLKQLPGLHCPNPLVPAQLTQYRTHGLHWGQAL